MKKKKTYVPLHVFPETKERIKDSARKKKKLISVYLDELSKAKE